MSQDLEQALKLAERAARTGGQLALYHFRKGIDARRKPDGSPVTDADISAEKAIRNVLEEGMPGVPVLGEEMGGGSPDQAATGSRWIVDPIDGTRNFIKGIPIFATLVALERDGECVVGASYAPAMGDMTSAARGLGCRCNDRPVRVSDVDSLQQAFFLFGGINGLLQPESEKRFLALMNKTDRQRSFGDYYGHQLVALGRAEMMLETGIHPWDIAPFKIIIEEAGGRFTDLSGQPSIYNGSALATNGRLHDEVLSIWNGSPAPSGG
ncbi:MAG: histidinol phosphate phosphatase [Candidatus Eisenbacteria bacterium]|uniref:Histidinol phosphate phosphatase n=1 Tax=Eiseniibacteriota bacterium TaxID=2212470 RepID=A0A948RZH2_UNCEI|nr:histidinol phosphate phosphatase [Candidatus Eisenbacteria bacterium]MBU1949999.1 histidinol phosphate phosphatase [Candidatus Eisenbacteria bacterium]MBU2691084.1 histidinol phosphate phosphatase [Candidatus Eisenbacteria bacterium]